MLPTPPLSNVAWSIALSLCALCGCLETARTDAGPHAPLAPPGMSGLTGTAAMGTAGAGASDMQAGPTRVPIAPTTAGAAGAPAKSAGPIAAGPAGRSDWVYRDVAGAVCRDGSPAGYYLRPGRDAGLLILLNGGGVCYDDFLCSLNPANVNESLSGETLIDATASQFGSALIPMPQEPPAVGILSQDPRNPLAGLTMMFVPYCTGDVFAGTQHDAPVITSSQLPPQQFVGYTNLGLFYDSLEPELRASERVVFAGTSAGSFGVLLNYDRTQEAFSHSTLLAIADSGVAFRDPYLEPCLQRTWRSLWGLDHVLPAACKGCFNADGGGLLQGLGDYLFHEKYAGRLFGGLISSEQDQIIKLFFSAGLNDCANTDTTSEAVASAIGLSSYPPTRYPEALRDVIDNVAGRERIASYLLTGDLHQHVISSRYFEDNGLGRSIADWVGELLAGQASHVSAGP